MRATFATPLPLHTLLARLSATVNPSLPFNVRRHDDHLEYQVALPGVARDQVKVDIKERRLELTITVPDDAEEGVWLHRTFQPTSFTQRFDLSPTVDASAITARHENGVLFIRLPFAKDATARQVDIEG